MSERQCCLSGHHGSMCRPPGTTLRLEGDGRWTVTREAPPWRPYDRVFHNAEVSIGGWSGVTTVTLVGPEVATVGPR